jgi:hypothetical protein
MQVKFAFAASRMRKGGEASIGVAAFVVAASGNRAAANVILERTARSAASLASFHPDKQNKKQAAARSKQSVQLVRPYRFVPACTPRPATPPTRTGFARQSACRNGGTFSANVLTAAQTALGIGATILAGGVRAGKGTPPALGMRRRRVGPQAGCPPACRHQDADFAQHGEARFRTLVPKAACAAFDVKKCAASIEMPKTLRAMHTPHPCAGTACLTLGVGGGSLGSDITLHDFKDSVRAVPDVVKVQ